MKTETAVAQSLDLESLSDHVPAIAQCLDLESLLNFQVCGRFLHRRASPEAISEIWAKLRPENIARILLSQSMTAATAERLRATFQFRASHVRKDIAEQLIVRACCTNDVSMLCWYIASFGIAGFHDTHLLDLDDLCVKALESKRWESYELVSTTFDICPDDCMIYDLVDELCRAGDSESLCRLGKLLSANSGHNPKEFAFKTIESAASAGHLEAAATMVASYNCTASDLTELAIECLDYRGKSPGVIEWILENYVPECEPATLLAFDEYMYGIDAKTDSLKLRKEYVSLACLLDSKYNYFARINEISKNRTHLLAQLRTRMGDRWTY